MTRVMLTTITAVLLFFIMFSLGYMIMLSSGKTTGITYFENRNNSSIKIVERTDNIGLFGEGPKETYKIKPLLLWFIISTKIDTIDIVKDEWKRIKSP